MNNSPAIRRLAAERRRRADRQVFQKISNGPEISAREVMAMLLRDGWTLGRGRRRLSAEIRVGRLTRNGLTVWAQPHDGENTPGRTPTPLHVYITFDGPTERPLLHWRHKTPEEMKAMRLWRLKAHNEKVVEKLETRRRWQRQMAD